MVRILVGNKVDLASKKVSHLRACVVRACALCVYVRACGRVCLCACACACACLHSCMCELMCVGFYERVCVWRAPTCV